MILPPLVFGLLWLCVSLVSAESLTGPRLLVVLEETELRNTYSKFFADLAGELPTPKPLTVQLVGRFTDDFFFSQVGDTTLISNHRKTKIYRYLFMTRELMTTSSSSRPSPKVRTGRRERAYLVDSLR
jgi:hypothetical protein